MITFVSSNKNKSVRFAAAMDRYGFQTSWANIELEERQHTSITDIARDKALQAFKKHGKPIAVEDSGLCIPEWNGYPGALTKPIVEQMGIGNFLASTMALRDRSCYFMRTLGFADIRGNIDVITSVHESGRLMTETQDGPSKWSPLSLIFATDGYNTSMAAMTPEQVVALNERWRPDDIAEKFAALVSQSPQRFGYNRLPDVTPQG